MNARDRKKARRDNKRRRKVAAKAAPVERALLPPRDRSAPTFSHLLQHVWSQASTPYGTEAGRVLLGGLPPEGNKS